MRKMAEKSELQSTVNFYHANKLSFFPLPLGEKMDSKFKWGEFQKRRPTTTEIKSWFGNGDKHNIAVVCGQVSDNLVILDCDTEARFYELALIICEKLEIDDILDFTRVSKTGKGYHIWLFTEKPVQSVKFPKLDIKGEGGYIVAPPSIHPDGPEYKFVNPLQPIRHIKTLLDIGLDLMQKKDNPQENNYSDNWITNALQGITEGDRNDICYKLASHFKNSQPIDITEKLLLGWNTKNKPPLDETEILQTIKSAYGRIPLEPPNGVYRTTIVSSVLSDPNTERDKGVTDIVTVSLSELIGNWVKDTSGWFAYDDIDREFDIKTSQEKDNRRQIIKRLRDNGVIEAHPKQNKLFRFINTTVRLIDFKSALGHKSLDIKYPFGIEKYYKTYPGNIIVVAGVPDAGKTAFLLNFIKMNQDKFSIFYQSSEMGQDELANRLGNFEGISIDDWNFVAEERSSNFADIIRPDCVNIIDYMEVTGDFYMVAEYLKQIHDRLSTGIAIIAIQKDPKSDQGRGGSFSLEKPRLYLNIDPGKITMRKVKNWTDPTLNPNRLQAKFKLVAGCRFIIEEDWKKPDDI